MAAQCRGISLFSFANNGSQSAASSNLTASFLPFPEAQCNAVSPVGVRAHTLQPAAIRALLKANVNLRRQNEYGETALSIAEKDGGNELVKALLNATLTVSYQKSVRGTALHIAIVEGDAQATIREIQHAVGDIFFQNSDGETALHLAAKTGDAEMVKILFAAERQLWEQRKSKLAQAAERVDPRRDDWADDFYNPALDASFGRLEISGRGGDRQMPTGTSSLAASENESLTLAECTPVWSLQLKEV